MRDLLVRTAGRCDSLYARLAAIGSETLAASIAVSIENARRYARIKASEEKLRAQVGALRRDLARRDRFTDMVGSDSAMSECSG